MDFCFQCFFQRGRLFLDNILNSSNTDDGCMDFVRDLLEFFGFFEENVYVERIFPFFVIHLKIRKDGKTNALYYSMEHHEVEAIQVAYVASLKITMH